MQQPPPRSIELWSYLIGLGPVGEPVSVTLDTVCQDLQVRTKSHLCQLASSLVRYGAIQNVGTWTYVVLKRIGREGEPKKGDRPKRINTGIIHFEQTKGAGFAEDVRRRFDEIPTDTRDLTQRFFGDPIPGDPRRPWQGAHA